MITGKAKVEFGSGDVLITPMVKQDLSKGCIVLQNKGTHVIGEYSSTENFKMEESDTLITFSKTESIDVLIERLQKLRNMMNGELNDCTLSEQYEY